MIDSVKSKSASLRFCKLIGGYLYLANQVWEIGFNFAKSFMALVNEEKYDDDELYSSV